MRPFAPRHRFHLVLFLVVGALPLASFAGADGSRLSWEQALAAARGYVLAGEDARPDAVVDYELVGLDPRTWGRNYFAFRFPDRGTSHYYVSKTNGFVSPVFMLSGATPEDGSTKPADRQILRPLLPSVDHVPPTITKVVGWADYVITVTFPETLAASNEDVEFRCVAWASGENLPPYRLQEYKFVVRLQRANAVGAVTFIVSKTDAERFPTLDICLLDATGGSHWSPKIADIRAP